MPHNTKPNPWFCAPCAVHAYINQTQSDMMETGSKEARPYLVQTIQHRL